MNKCSKCGYGRATEYGYKCKKGVLTPDLCEENYRSSNRVTRSFATDEDTEEYLTDLILLFNGKLNRSAIIREGVRFIHKYFSDYERLQMEEEIREDL